jgi:hypothetical protein
MDKPCSINPIRHLLVYIVRNQAERGGKDLNLMGELQFIEQLIGIVSDGILSRERDDVDSCLRNFHEG